MEEEVMLALRQDCLVDWVQGGAEERNFGWCVSFKTGEQIKCDHVNKCYVDAGKSAG